jgi:hypothetical protein
MLMSDESPHLYLPEIYTITQATHLAQRAEFRSMCDSPLEAWLIALDVSQTRLGLDDIESREATSRAMEIAYRVQRHARQTILFSMKDTEQDAVLYASSDLFPYLLRNVANHYRSCGDYLVSNPSPEESTQLEPVSNRLIIPTSIINKLASVCAIPVPERLQHVIWATAVEISVE